MIAASVETTCPVSFVADIPEIAVVECVIGCAGMVNKLGYLSIY